MWSSWAEDRQVWSSLQHSVSHTALLTVSWFIGRFDREEGEGA